MFNHRIVYDLVQLRIRSDMRDAEWSRQAAIAGTKLTRVMAVSEPLVSVQPKAAVAGAKR